MHHLLVPGKQGPFDLIRLDCSTIAPTSSTHFSHSYRFFVCSLSIKDQRIDKSYYRKLVYGLNWLSVTC